MRATTKQQGPSHIRGSSLGLGTRLPSATCIFPIGWHHAIEAYHIPHSSLYKPCPRLPGFLFGFLTVKDGTDRLSQNVPNKLPSLRRAQFFFLFEIFLHTRYLQIILCKLRRLEVVFPFLFFNDCELRQQNTVPIFSSFFALLLFFFLLYKFVTWHALSGLFLKF